MSIIALHIRNTKKTKGTNISLRSVDRLLCIDVIGPYFIQENTLNSYKGYIITSHLNFQTEEHCDIDDC